MADRRGPTIVLALSLATVLALSGTAVLFAAAHASPSATVSSSATSPIRRSVVWYGLPGNQAPRTFHIESTSLNAPSPDEFQITYADGNFTLIYQRQAGGPITNQYTMTVRGLVEWNDTLGDGVMEDGSVVAYTPLGPSEFGRYAVRHSNTAATSGIEVNSFAIVSNHGEVALNLTISDGFLTLPSGQTLTPMEAKLSLDIYHNMTTPGTRLALQIGFSTSQTVRLDNQSWDDLNDFSTDDRALNVSNDVGHATSSAFFAWSNTAAANGHSGPVVPTGPSGNATNGDYDLYLSYPRPDSSLQLHVVHDPAMGVVSAAYASIVNPGPGAPLPFVGDALLYGISLAGIATLVGGTAILVNRRRRKEP